MTRVRIIQLALLFSLAHSGVARAERLSTRIFTTADGLANNLVNYILLDSHGYLWFCTREGLSRFDGYGFVTYGVVDGLPSAAIQGLVETKQGFYWIATNQGLVRFDPLGTRPPSNNGRPMFTKFLPDADPKEEDVAGLFQDRKGSIWVGTRMGLYKLNEAGTGSVTFQRIDLAGAQVGQITEDGAGALWIATSAGVFRRFPDGRLEQYTVREGLPANGVSSLLVDRQGRIWVGTVTSGLAVLTADQALQRPTVAVAYSTRNGLPGNWVNRIFEARNGAVWAATTGGLAEIVPTADPHRYRLRSFGAALGLAFPSFRAIAEDRIGNLWVGTEGGGVAKIPATQFTVYGEADGIRATGTLFETPGDGVIGTELRGDWRFFRCADRRPIVAPLPFSVIPSWGWNQMALVDSEGDWWIGTRSGVLRYHGIRHLEQLAHATPVARYTKRDGLAADVVIRLFEDSRRDVWIATVGETAHNGLSRWERKSGALHHYIPPR